ncbi:MAG: hypothetical protein Q8L48_16200 [Archangium sp.]|nr:hypothetical protein [Archangium sp.]
MKVSLALLVMAGVAGLDTPAAPPPKTDVVVPVKAPKTIWEGVVGPGDTRVVQTGQGVFGFIALRTTDCFSLSLRSGERAG